MTIRSKAKASGHAGVGTVLGVLAIGVAGLAAYFIWGLPALGVVGVAALALTPLVPEMVALVGIAALYLNLPGIAVVVHGLPASLAATTWLLLLAPFLVKVLLRREPVIIDAPFLFILAFLGSVSLSLLGVRDTMAAGKWMITFLTEGVLIYFLTVNTFRTMGSLRRAINVLIICGALLGGLTVYQEVTHSYGQQFAGLAQRNIEYGTGDETIGFTKKDRLRDPNKIHLRERSSGPIGDPNRYAQILIVLLPLAYYAMRARVALFSKLAKAGAAALILAGALLTYSRGGFVGIAAQLALLKAMSGIRMRELALFLAAAAVAVVLLAPGYVIRLESFAGISNAYNQTRGEQSEGVVRGRLTEMMAAFNVFLDHPLLGVGPGQYLPVYSTAYMSNPDIALRRITSQRRAHTLYFELAAETGIIGLLAFLGAVGLIEVRLWQAWRRWRRRRYPEMERLAAGFFLAIVGYLATGIFLHLAFQRYYWLLLGMAGAALQVMSDANWQYLYGNGRSGNDTWASKMPVRTVAPSVVAPRLVAPASSAEEPSSPEPIAVAAGESTPAPKPAGKSSARARVSRARRRPVPSSKIPVGRTD